MSRPSRWKLLIVLTAGIISISSGSILVKMSQEAPSLVIAFYRMAWASLLLSPFYLARRPPFGSGQWVWFSIAGTALALHFAFWIGSLRYTTVAVSVLLVNTSPVLVALISYILFGERLRGPGIVGLILALAGSAVLFSNDIVWLGSWQGPALALAGAAMLGCYLVAGRSLRRRVSLLIYIFPTYLLAALILGLLILWQRLPLIGYSSSTHAYLWLLGLVPQCVGHTSYNWALRHLSATVISTLVLVEPVLATFLAWWLLGETVGAPVWLGGALTASGIVLVSGWGVSRTGAEESE